MAQLNPQASEWRPPGASAAAEEAAAASYTPSEATPQHAPQDPAMSPPHWHRYPAREGGDTDQDDSDYYDDANMAWADEQALLADQARIQGRMLSDPTGAAQQQGGGTYHPSTYGFQPRAYQAPMPTVAGGASTLPTHAPAWYPQQQTSIRIGGVGAASPQQPMPVHQHMDLYEETASQAPTNMTTATSVQVGVAVPKLTGKEKRRNFAKEAAKQQRRNLIAQKSGLEAFSVALLHSVSPFMAPLRSATKSSLPHIKVDQRYGRRGQPQTAVMQFVIAPVVNYRPAHFHDLAPGDVLEYHFDLSQVLRVIQSAYCLCINYGKDWKPYALPYAYLSCRDYKQEVLKLCPDEAPNAKSDAVYEDDIMKDVTRLILAVPELELFKRKSFNAAIRGRANLYPMYAVFASLFSGVSNYQIQIRDFNAVPPVFILKTSRTAIADSPQPIVISGNKELWGLLKNVPPSFATGTLVPATSTSSPAVEAKLNEMLPESSPAPETKAASSRSPAPATPYDANRTTLLLCGAALVVTVAALAIIMVPSKRK
jgi:hypothetical protein